MIHRSRVILTALLVLSVSEIRSAEQRPRWLAIVAPGLVETVQPLAARRRAEGWNVQQYSVSDGDSWEHQRAWIRSQAGDASVRTCVVLVGDWFTSNQGYCVPSAAGEQGRMRGTPTDYAFSLPNAVGKPAIAVGRLPARSPDELKAMIAKIVRFEEQEFGPWSNRVNLWVGHPGGGSAIQKKLAESIIQGTIGMRLRSIPPAWDVRAVVDFPGTQFTVPRDDVSSRLMNEWERGQCFGIYAGHSGAAGFWSDGRYLVSTQAIQSMRIKHSQGVFITTGCYACQLTSPEEQAYLPAAIRNPYGPVACIGPYAESYAAHGQLVLDALVNCLKAENPPDLHLGASWLAAQSGIAEGSISPLKFWLYDQADGSRGRVPLKKQRLEHLEMWTLLGDPALRLRSLEPTLDVVVRRIEHQPNGIRVTVEFPNEFVSGRVFLGCGVRAAGRTSRPFVHVQAEPASIETITAVGREFDQEVSLEESIEGKDVLVRVCFSTGNRGWLGVGQSLDRD